MTNILMQDTVEVTIDAPPERVWSLVTDITRMGEWSPVCTGGEWLDEPSTPVVGARFVGHSRQAGARWSRECVVTSAEPGREFSFHTIFRGHEATRWRYCFEQTTGGTRVVESYEVLVMPRWVRAFRRVPGMTNKSQRDTRRAMVVTLERLKGTAERGS